MYLNVALKTNWLIAEINLLPIQNDYLDTLFRWYSLVQTSSWLCRSTGGRNLHNGTFSHMFYTSKTYSPYSTLSWLTEWLLGSKTALRISSMEYSCGWKETNSSSCLLKSVVTSNSLTCFEQLISLGLPNTCGQTYWTERYSSLVREIFFSCSYMK